MYARGLKIASCFWVLALFGCKKDIPVETEEIKIAFMADVHFADVYPDFEG